MSDSKYQNLPGIAFDQPDTYETPDLPESDQYLDYQQTYDEPNANIETPNISVEAAFERFRLERVSGKADFNSNQGYSPFLEKESKEERLARIRLEVSELLSEFKESKGGEKECGELVELERELSKLNRTKFRNGLELRDRVEGFRSSSTEKGNSLHYELHLEKKGSSYGGTKGTELEARLLRLEQVLGTTKDSLAPLGLQPKNSSILGALTVMHSKLGLLEPAHIELIESKLSSVLSKVASIAEKKMDVQDLERSLKLSTLFELLESSSATIEALPELSERLDSLKELHREASEVIREIGAIRSVQDGIAAGMSENEKLLSELKSLITALLPKN